MRKNLAAAAIFLVLSISALAQPYTIQQYLNIKSAGSPTLSPDGKQMAYLTNTTGTSQVWMVDLPSGTPKQLTNYEDNVGFARWLPDGSGIIFGKARGGDENTQFFWMKTDGTGVRALTDDPKVRNNFAEISKDGKKIYYASNKRNRTFFDVYSMEIATGKEELLYQYDGNINIAAVNDAGTKFVLSRDGIEKSLDNDLYLVDVATKKETHLTPHTEASEYDNVHFLGGTIILTTNDKREFATLVQMRKKNGRPAGEVMSYVPPISFVNDSAVSVTDLEMDPPMGHGTWDVGSVAMAANPTVMAYVVNREGFSDLYLTNVSANTDYATVSGSASGVNLPAQGLVGGLTFSKDQSKLAFSFSSATKNGDIWLYDLNTKKLSQVTNSDRSGLDPKTFTAPELVKIKSFDGLEIPAWYYKPRPVRDGTKTTISSDGSRRTESLPALQPVIVSVHGGPEGQSRPGFNPLFQYYLSRGYAVLDPNVRGSTGYGKTYTHLDDVEKREDSVKDLAAAHEWLVKNGGADPKRIAVTGGSYGGYMTMAAITLYPDLWAAAVGTVAITNWETFLTNTSGYRRRQREVEYGRLDKDIDFLRRISPIRKIDQIKTPLFVISGKNDPRVPYTEGEQMVEALKRRNAIVEYKLYDDEGHGISKLKNRLDLYPRVADFLGKYMK